MSYFGECPKRKAYLQPSRPPARWSTFSSKIFLALYHNISVYKVKNTQQYVKCEQSLHRPDLKR